MAEMSLRWESASAHVSLSEASGSDDCRVGAVSLVRESRPRRSIKLSTPLRSLDALGDVLSASEGDRPGLMRMLQQAQDALGYLSAETITRIARRFKLSEAEVFGVATFYAQFRFIPPGRHHLRVCLGTACHVKGGAQILATIEQRFGAGAGETTSDGEYDIERVACLGCCALAPVITLDTDLLGGMSVLRLQEVLDARGRD